MRAQVSRWMFFEQDYLQSGIASIRHWMLTGKDKHYGEAAVAVKRSASDKTLSILDKWLTGRNYFVESGYTIADMAISGYVGFAHEGGIDLNAYPHVAA